MKSVLMMLAGVALAVGADAMPTEDEIAKVKPVVQALTASDYAAMKEGKKTRSQVAETLVGYVNDAESEAAKLLLLREAFNLYLVSAEFEKAFDAFSALNENVKDVPKGMFGAWSAQQTVQLAKKGRADGLSLRDDAGDAKTRIVGALVAHHLKRHARHRLRLVERRAVLLRLRELWRERQQKACRGRAKARHDDICFHHLSIHLDPFSFVVWWLSGLVVWWFRVSCLKELPPNHLTT